MQAILLDALNMNYPNSRKKSYFMAEKMEVIDVGYYFKGLLMESFSVQMRHS